MRKRDMLLGIVGWLVMALLVAVMVATSGIGVLP